MLPGFRGTFDEKGKRVACPFHFLLMTARGGRSCYDIPPIATI
jgi:hypothetical protein